MKKILIIHYILLALGAITAIAVVVFFDPLNSVGEYLWGVILSFLSGFSLFLFAGISLLLYFFRRTLLPVDSPKILIRTSMRDACILSCALCFLLLMQILRTLTVLNLLLLISIVITLEGYFFTRPKT